MNFKKSITIISIVLIFYLPSTTFSQCNLNELLDKLNSNNLSDRYYALVGIESCSLTESLDILEVKIHSETNLSIKQLYLRVIYNLGSENIQSVIYDFLDEISSFNPDDPLIDIELARFEATRILINISDYSTVSYLFEYVDTHSNLPVLTVFPALEKVILNEPSYEESARQVLIDYVNNSNSHFIRALALIKLIMIYNDSEINNICADISTNDDSMGVRLVGFQGLFKNNYYLLQSHLLNRLDQDPSWYLRHLITDSLLIKFGTPVDLKTVIDYQPLEPDETASSLMEYSIDNFIPPKPDSNVTIDEMLRILGDYIDDLYQYDWILNENKYQEFIQQLGAILNAILPGPSTEETDYSLAIPEVERFIQMAENAFGNEEITREGYAFLFYYPSYIKVRMEEF